MRREEQRSAAFDAAARAMSRLLDRNVTAAEASAVASPESCGSAEDLAKGARLLGDLEAATLRRGASGSASTMDEVGVICRASCRRSGGEGGDAKSHVFGIGFRWLLQIRWSLSRGRSCLVLCACAFVLRVFMRGAGEDSRNVDWRVPVPY